MVGREVTKSSDEVRAALDKESAPADAADGAAAGDVAASPGTERGGEGGSLLAALRKKKPAGARGAGSGGANKERAIETALLKTYAEQVSTIAAPWCATSTLRTPPFPNVRTKTLCVHKYNGLILLYRSIALVRLLHATTPTQRLWSAS